jgi:hypothetical protein
MKYFYPLIALALFVIQSQQPPEFPRSGTKADVFDVAMLVADGDKISPEDVSLRLSEDSLIIEARCHCAIIKEFKYSDIKAVKYSPKEHRLAVKSDADQATLKLNESHCKAILSALETRGVKIETAGEERWQ